MKVSVLTENVEKTWSQRVRVKRPVRAGLVRPVRETGQGSLRLSPLTLLSQGGLTVVDIYSDWAGPCTAMSAALKKIKLEVGDDSLVYAMARSDSIPALEMFQGQCKPTYLFIASGQPVAVMHGANAPLMKTMVQDMMEVERRVQAGELERPTITLEEAVPGQLFCACLTL